MASATGLQDVGHWKHRTERLARYLLLCHGGAWATSFCSTAFHVMLAQTHGTMVTCTPVRHKQTNPCES